MTTSSPTQSSSARETVLVDVYTDGVLDPAKPMAGPVRARSLALAKEYGLDNIEATAPISVIGTGANLNSATNNGLARAAALLDRTVAEVKNRATISGGIEIGPHPGVIQVTCLVPRDKLAACGLLRFAETQYGLLT